MTVTAEEVGLLNDLRRMQGMPPLTPAELPALEAERVPAARPLPPATAEEQEALAYLRRAQGLDPAPAPDPASRPAPAVAAAPGLSPLVVAGAPLTDKERAELRQIDAEYRQDGRGPLTADKAARLVALWRSRSAA